MVLFHVWNVPDLELLLFVIYFLIRKLILLTEQKKLLIRRNQPTGNVTLDPAQSRVVGKIIAYVGNDIRKSALTNCTM